jgi:hypothetical protein
MPQRQAVEFRVEIGEYRGVVRVPLARVPTPNAGLSRLDCWIGFRK